MEKKTPETCVMVLMERRANLRGFILKPSHDSEPKYNCGYCTQNKIMVY